MIHFLFYACVEDTVGPWTEQTVTAVLEELAVAKAGVLLKGSNVGRLLMVVMC